METNLSSSSFKILFIAWLTALVSTAGSLFFSEVMQFPPCSLCWYQRICMYPLVLIIGVALFSLDRKVLKYSLPLALIGWFFALYHNLLHWKIIPESAAPCRQGVACSTVYIDWLGFLTIPLMSLSGFTLILVLLMIFSKHTKNEVLNAQS